MVTLVSELETRVDPGKAAGVVAEMKIIARRTNHMYVFGLLCLPLCGETLV